MILAKAIHSAAFGLLIGFGACACTAVTRTDKYEIVPDGGVGEGGVGDGGAREQPARVHGDLSTTGRLPSQRDDGVRLMNGGFVPQRSCADGGRCVTGGVR